LDKQTEVHFDFENTPKRFLDVETGEHIDLYSDSIKVAYQDSVAQYFEALKLKCAQYRIKYVSVDIGNDFSTVFNTFMTERQKFI